MYWGKADIGESSPPSMCLPSNGQGSILGRQGSEGPDDLRVTNLGQHHPTQPPTPTNPYDALANALASSKGASASAFTPIQTVVLNNVIYFSSFFHFILLFFITLNYIRFICFFTHYMFISFFENAQIAFLNLTECDAANPSQHDRWWWASRYPSVYTI